MANLSKSSLEKLSTCHSDLQEVLKIVIQKFDFTVLEGHRGEEKQNQYFKEGKSKVKFPFGKHNSNPSEAIDIAPYPIDWNDRERFILLAGLVKGVALAKGINIRWGGDWDSDNQMKDQNFNDLPHFELA